MIENFQDYVNRSKAVYQAEKEIIADKLKEGINGLEWLVLHTLVDERQSDSLKKWTESVMVRLCGKKPLELFIEAVRLDPETFCARYKLSWGVTIDQALTYLSLLRERDYESYFTIMQTIDKR